ncbi:MAG: GGDEF domain-containing protein [Gaiellales bacterium]
MGPTAVGLTVALATLAALTLCVVLAVRARNASDTRTRDTLRRIGDGVEALTLGLSSIAETAKAETAELGRSVGITLDLEEALRRTAAAAASLPGMQAGAARIVGLDGEVSQQSVGISSGLVGLDADFAPPDRSGWTSAILSWRRPAETAATGVVQAGIVAPVVHEGTNLGLVAAYSTGLSRPDEAAVERLTWLANQAAPALAAAREHAAVKALVRRDALTGLLNRRGLDESLAHEIARASRNGTVLSLLMIDIDGFRLVNKLTYAHGDAVLREFANALGEACRTTDIICRRGGDEFLLLLPDTPCLEALRLEARVRAVVATTDFTNVSRLTYSAGITSYRPGDTVDEVDRRASVLVNEVKAAGRNGMRHDCQLDDTPAIVSLRADASRSG